MLTVAGGGETRDTDIDPGLTAGGRQRIGRHVITRQHQHPPGARALDLNRLHPPLDLAMHVNLDLADALQIHPLLPGQPAGAIAVFGPLHTVEPSLALESRIPRLDAGLLTRWKNPANALFNRRSVACCDENDHTSTSGRTARISVSCAD